MMTPAKKPMPLSVCCKLAPYTTLIGLSSASLWEPVSLPTAHSPPTLPYIACSGSAGLLAPMTPSCLYTTAPCAAVAASQAGEWHSVWGVLTCEGYDWACGGSGQDVWGRGCRGRQPDLRVSLCWGKYPSQLWHRANKAEDAVFLKHVWFTIIMSNVACKVVRILHFVCAHFSYMPVCSW